MNDISIDLETLSASNDAAIISIGAACFDRTTGEIGETYYAEIDLDSAISFGHVSGSTLSWWMAQSSDAKKVMAQLTDSDGSTKKQLAAALAGLSNFVKRCPDAKVWGNGATFDISILENAYRRVGWQCLPWEYFNVRDMRTLVETATALGFDKKTMPFGGIQHNAVDDAVHQARVISGCWWIIVYQQRMFPGNEVRPIQISPHPAATTVEAPAQ